jgi:hypothetical protein
VEIAASAATVFSARERIVKRFAQVGQRNALCAVLKLKRALRVGAKRIADEQAIDVQGHGGLAGG